MKGSHMKKTLLCCLILAACLLSACGSSKNGAEPDSGRTTGDAGQITSAPDGLTPTESAKPEPTKEPDPDTVIERGSFYWVFNGAADSIWFFTHQDGNEGSPEILEDTVDMIVEKTGTEIVVYNVKTAPLAKWIILSDEDIKNEAKAYPSIRFSMLDAIFTQPAEGSEGETLSFFFGDQIGHEGDWPVSAGGLFTIPVKGVFNDNVYGIDVSGFCYEGRELDIGLTDQYYLYCATDIGYSLDRGDLGGRIHPWNETARRVMEARKDYRYVGVSYEGMSGWSEILGDPKLDINIATTRNFCDYTWTDAELWPYELDQSLASEIVFRSMEGSGALKRFFPEGKGAPAVNFNSDFLFTRGTTDDKAEAMINATPYIYMAHSTKLPSEADEGYVVMGCYERTEDDTVRKTENVIRRGKALPKTPGEEYDGTFIVADDDMLPLYEEKLEMLLDSPSGTEWEDRLCETVSGHSGLMMVNLWMKQTDGKVEYKITYTFDDGFEKTEVVEAN